MRKQNKRRRKKLTPNLAVGGDFMNPTKRVLQTYSTHNETFEKRGGKKKKKVRQEGRRKEREKTNRL